MATTSPSTTVPSGKSASASTMWGNCRLKDFFLRENSVRPVRDFTARARYPSTLISQIHWSPPGSFDTDRHSIGSMNEASVLGNESKRARIFSLHCVITGIHSLLLLAAALLIFLP